MLYSALPSFNDPAIARPSLRQHRIAPLATVVLLCTVVIWMVGDSMAASASELRRTAIVKAVQQAQPSIVNIRGQKTVDGSNLLGQPVEAHRVNGMGTGVVIDSRGYIITNQHVVDGVEDIGVTLFDGTEHTARLISRDAETDLALIKIDPRGSTLPVIRIGTSSDLMLGEPVVAVGNAYGYPHTVTRGIISALHRTVQVSDTQSYRDLIQTDASINPGNSGGPLLNIDGELIGINVAVRVGAQGIGFALPVDKVVEVTADLISIKRLDGNWHGVVAADRAGRDSVVVKAVEPSSPAAEAGVRPGDVIEAVADLQVKRAVDVERALLGSNSGREVEFHVRRANQSRSLTLVLTSLPNPSNTGDDPAWRLLGMRLKPLPASQFRDGSNRYRGGLAITAVRSGSPASDQGIRPGDVLVGMHIWETISLDNVDYVLNHQNLSEFEPLKFYILRGKQTLYGHLQIPSLARHQLSRK